MKSKILGECVFPEEAGYTKVTKSTVYPAVPEWRMVAVYALYAKGLPTCMSQVPKYTRGLGKKFKSYEAAIKARPHIEYFR